VPSLVQLCWEEMGKGPHSEAYACLTFVCTSDCVETLGVAKYTDTHRNETREEKKAGADSETGRTLFSSPRSSPICALFDNLGIV